MHILAPQTSLSERALELLALPDDGVPRLLLDLGCGSCLSSDVITEAGHAWVVRGMLEISQAAGARSNGTSATSLVRHAQRFAHLSKRRKPPSHFVSSCTTGPGHQPGDAGGGGGAGPGRRHLPV